MFPIMSRKQAIESGTLKYSTGKPCNRGHFTYRYTKTGACAACVLGYNHKYSQLAKEAAEAKLRGLCRITYNLHPEDAKLVNDFVAALEAARNLEMG